MKKPESTFITSVHKHLPVDLYHLKTHNMYVGGPADVWYSGVTDDLWVEYKHIEVPKRPGTLIDMDFSPLQIEWLQDRYYEGRNVCAIVGSKTGGVIFAHCDWENDFTASQYLARIVKRENLAQWITSRVNLKGAEDVRIARRPTRKTARHAAKSR